MPEGSNDNHVHAYAGNVRDYVRGPLFIAGLGYQLGVKSVEYEMESSSTFEDDDDVLVLSGYIPVALGRGKQVIKWKATDRAILDVNQRDEERPSELKDRAESIRDKLQNIYRQPAVRVPRS